MDVKKKVVWVAVFLTVTCSLPIRSLNVTTIILSFKQKRNNNIKQPNNNKTTQIVAVAVNKAQRQFPF